MLLKVRHVNKERQLMYSLGVPPKQSTPLVEVLNSSAANISWTPPWIYPIDNYTLIVTDSMTNITLCTNASDIVIIKNSTDDCTLMYVKVVANTDVGPSEISDSQAFGFPKCK